MQTPKTRSSLSEVPLPRVCHRAARYLNPVSASLDSSSSSSSTTTKSASAFLQSANANNKTTSNSKDQRSPKVTLRRSPRSPAPERKRPSRISELESQILKHKEDLKKVRDQLKVSESCKKKAQQEVEDSKEKLLALSSKLEYSDQLLKLPAIEKTLVVKQLSDNSASLTSAIDAIQQLKVQLELVANCENTQTQIAESSGAELQNVSESLSLMENMKNQLYGCKDSTQAHALVNETLKQLEAAKRTVEFLRSDSAKAVHGCNSAALELDQSRARVNSLEKLVNKLESCLLGTTTDNKCSFSRNLADDAKLEQEAENPNQIETEIHSLRSEVGLLRSAIEIAETKYQEEKIMNMVKIRNAYELIEKMKSESRTRESELEAELGKKKAEIEELKTKFVDKETKLKGVVDENERLNLKLQKSMSAEREYELKMETKRLYVCVAELKGDLMDKETTLQSMSKENEMLKLEINKRFTYAELEAAKGAERDAMAKLGIMMEEAERSNRMAVSLAEKLEAAEAVYSETEAELRRVKIQCGQWRKAAEAAVAIFSAGNNGKLAERSMSLDNNYSNELTNKYSGLCEEFDDDDDFQRKKNGNVLKKIGVLWKKPQKVTV